MSSFMNVMKNLVVRRIIIHLIASKNQVNLEINVSSSLTARNQIVAKIIVHIITRNIQVRLHNYKRVRTYDSAEVSDGDI